MTNEKQMWQLFCQLETQKKSSNHQVCNLCLSLAHLDPQGYVKVLSYNPPALQCFCIYEC